MIRNNKAGCAVSARTTALQVPLATQLIDKASIYADGRAS